MWTLSDQERLGFWYDFRNKLGNLSLEDAIFETNRFWNTAHIGNQYYSQTLYGQWPNPWQLILDNCYDDIAKALGILYTIEMSELDCDVQMICGQDTHGEFNLVSINNGLYTLNWDLDVQVNSPIIHNKNIVVQFHAAELIDRG